MKSVTKEINFIPDFMIIEKNQRRRMVTVAITTTIVTLFCFAVYFIPHLKLFKIERTNENTRIETTYLQDVREIKDKIDNMQLKLNQKKNILNEVGKEDMDVALLTEKLMSSAPKNVSLLYINATGRSKINAGYVINNPMEVENLVINLRELNMFEEVDMPNIPILDRKTEVVFSLKLKSNTALTKKAVDNIPPPAKSENNTEQTKPQTGTTQNKPQTSTTQTKPQTGTNQVKPPDITTTPPEEKKPPRTNIPTGDTNSSSTTTKSQ